MHLAKKVPRRFLKPAVCNYSTIISNSEIYNLVPKPVRKWLRYKARNTPNAFIQSCTFENSYGQCAVHQRCGINDDRIMSTAIRCSRNRLLSWSPLCITAYTFSNVQVLVNEFCLFGVFHLMPFCTRFPHMRCHIKGQGFGNKMYISELFTVVGYLHTAGFKNRRGTFLCQVDFIFGLCVHVWRLEVIGVKGKFCHFKNVILK